MQVAVELEPTRNSRRLCKRVSCTINRILRLRAVHRKDDLSDHMTLGEAFMRLAGVGQSITFRDRNLELRRLHRCTEALKFADAGDTVIADQAHAAPFLRRRLNSVRV